MDSGYFTLRDPFQTPKEKSLERSITTTCIVKLVVLSYVYILSNQETRENGHDL